MDPHLGPLPPRPRELPAGLRARLGPEERRTVRRCATALGVLGSGSLIGWAFWMYLVGHHPLLLIALSPLGRHLILVAPIVDPVAFVAVAVTRRMLFYLASFRLGRALGPAGIPWLEQRAARFARFVRWLERLFARAPRLVVLALPGPAISALAGMARMHQGLFAALAVCGLAVRMLLVVALGAWLREPIEAFLVLVDEYWVPGTLVMLSLVALHQWRRRAGARRAAGAA
jgi:membrane protein DedA with SNARE-associated domain